MRIVLLIPLLLILLLPQALAIGIIPPEANINFAPGAQGTFDVLVQNGRDEEVSTEVTITGDLSQYFTATNPDVPARSAAISEVTFALPDDIPPGMHTQRIRYTETSFSTGSGMTARTAVKVLVHVWKPYPGQYAELRVVPEHVPAGENTQLQLRIASRGDQSVYGDLDLRIEDADGKLMQSQVLNNVQVGANTDWKQYVLVTSKNWPPGKYHVKASYDYGARVAPAETELKIGTRSVIIANITDRYYKDVDVNRFELDVESMWNEQLSAVSARMQLGSTEGGTPTVTLAGFSKKTLVGYWDTDRSLAEGEHPAIVTVSFNNGDPVKRTFMVNVFNESTREESPGAVLELGLTDVLFFIVLLVFAGFVFLHMGRKEHR